MLATVAADLDANFAASVGTLWASDPRLARQIESAVGSPHIAVSPSRAGVPTARVTAAAGEAVALHSRYDPVAEAAALVEAADVGNSLIFYVHGFGLGYHVERLIERTSDDAILCIFEPDLALLRAACEARDLSAVFARRNLRFFTAADKGDLLTRLNEQMALITSNTVTIDHGPSLRVAGEFHTQIKTWLDEFASLSRTSIQTLVLNGRKTAENIAQNIGWYAAAPGVGRLKNRYAGKPAIIVSAGPSLRNNKHLLPGASANAVIIATQTTLQPLVDMGVEPDFVTSIDYHDICTRFFERLPPTIRTELVAEPKATSKIFALHPGPTSLVGNDFADGLLREMAGEIDKLRVPAGATVAHTAFYLAEHLGCDPIIFVGQDLGFADGLAYTPGTGHDDAARPEFGRFYTPEMRQWETIARDRRILRKIPDQHGRPMYTEERLYAYLQQFERDFLNSKARVIDATEGGARKRGTLVMPLAAAIATHCGSPIDRQAGQRPDMRWDRTPAVLACLQRRLAEAREMATVAGETLPLLREVADHLDDQPRVNHCIARIDALRDRMNGVGPCYDLVVQLTQATELKRFQADLRLSASRASGIERQRLQVERDIANVQSISTAAAEFQEMIRLTIDRLSDATPATADLIASAIDARKGLAA